jgi:hypothetical protein
MRSAERHANRGRDLCVLFAVPLLIRANAGIILWQVVGGYTPFVEKNSLLGVVISQFCSSRVRGIC